MAFFTKKLGDEALQKSCASFDEAAIFKVIGREIVVVSKDNDF